jgi:hypothetical protein
MSFGGGAATAYFSAGVIAGRFVIASSMHSCKRRTVIARAVARRPAFKPFAGQPPDEAHLRRLQGTVVEGSGRPVQFEEHAK